MPKIKPSVSSSELSVLSVPAFWPMAMAAGLFEEGEELYAKNLKFVEEEIKINEEFSPSWRHPIAFASICGRWYCASTESRAECRRSSMRLMRAIRP